MPVDSAETHAALAERVLVTGAAGFIGSALCGALVRSGCEVHGTSRTPRDRTDVCWWQVDLSEPDAITQILRKIRPSVVFHLASHVSGDRALEAVQPTVRDNLLTTVNVLTAACEAGGPRVILAGSMEECDAHDANATPGSPYAAAKTAAGHYARMFNALYGLPVVHLRVFMVYGPGQQDTTKLIPYVITSLLRGEQPHLSSGEREVDWIYVDEVATAFIAAARADRANGKTVDVGSGQVITIRSVVDRLTKIVGGSTRPLFGALNDRPFEHRRIADVGRTQKLIGWTSATPLDAGLERTVQWFRRAIEISRSA